MQEAFRGVPVCQGRGNGSLPGNARGFRGQDTVKRHGGLDIVMAKVFRRRARGSILSECWLMQAAISPAKLKGG